MAETARVTIGVRTYDRPLLLARAIEDVLAQTFHDWRMTIFNNGGDRAVVESVVARFAERLAGRVTVVHSETRLKPGAAVNAALPEPLGDFVVVHDDDDTWHPTFLARAVEHMVDAESDVAGVAVRLNEVEERLVNGDRIEIESTKAFNPHLERVNFQSVLICNPFPPIGFLVRSEAFRAVGGYDEQLSSAVDWMFLLGVLERNRVDVIREILANYHLRPNAATSYGNIVSDQKTMRSSDAEVIDHYLERAMRAGEISPARVALAISQVDRENHERLNEALDHLRELRLLAGDIEFRTRQIHALLASHEETFRRLGKVLSPITKLARATRRWRGRT
ncbi:MAG: glycosyltransferase [Solirubrobacterales bacterium]